MKIVNRKEFMRLPSGTLYVDCDTPWAWNDLSIKYDSLFYDDIGTGDWVRAGFTDIESHDSEELVNRWYDMYENGASYPLELDCAGRDGYFERDALFMIYEPADVRKLADFFNQLVSELSE